MMELFDGILKDLSGEQSLRLNFLLGQSFILTSNAPALVRLGLLVVKYRVGDDCGDSCGLQSRGIGGQA